MRLKELLSSMPNVHWDERLGDETVASISCDSRVPQDKGLFVALGGFKFNGADFIKDAISNGAIAIAKTDSARQVGDYHIPESVAVIQVADAKIFLRLVTAKFYGDPSSKVKTIGITGTNGKTTITYLLESIIHADKKKCGVIGTVNYRIGNEILPSKNTTPGFLENQQHLAKLAGMAIPYSIMEVSSHALSQGRVDGIDFKAAIFTNLTQDHLDYHKDMESYFEAKSLLFTRLSDYACALINVDDAYGRRLLAISKGKILTYGIDGEAQVRATNIQYNLSGTRFDIVFKDETLSVVTPLVGRHNVYNILSAASCAYGMGFSLSVIAKGLASLDRIPGRLEPVAGIKYFFVFIDYAHTEDGLANVLGALRTVSKAKITVVFGCGGDRDRMKRPKMGRVVCEMADHAIVTSDNPRSEDPQAIIDEILTGFTKDNYEVCVDRRDAIARAIKSAAKGSIILLAGKGHEDYQVLKDKTIPFDERVIVRELAHV